MTSASAGLSAVVVALRATAPRDGVRSRGARRRPAGLEALDPSLDSGLAKATVTAEAHVRDPSGPGLRPDPIGPHAQALGDLAGGQQPVHSAQLADALMFV